MRRIYVNWNKIYEDGKSILDEMVEEIFVGESTKFHEVAGFVYNNIEVIVVEIKYISFNLVSRDKIDNVGLYIYPKSYFSYEYIPHPNAEYNHFLNEMRGRIKVLNPK